MKKPKNEKQDKAMDKKAGVKENSKADKKMDASWMKPKKKK